MIGPFAYDELTFEPISLAELGVQSEDFINFSIYGRVDTRIFKNPASHMLIENSNSHMTYHPFESAQEANSYANEMRNSAAQSAEFNNQDDSRFGAISGGVDLTTIEAQ